MRKKHATQQDEAEINLTPMLDIVFIMLIFFIVTATFVKEIGIDVSKPQDNQEEQKEEVKNIAITVTEDGWVWMEKRRIDLMQVQSNVERLKAERPNAAVVVIIAGEKTETGIVTRVMDEARQAVGNTSITLLRGEKPVQ
ncbi:MAG: biopolymer transporter ExbD [Alphaproteobacteria bacterium]|nr:biopolymer transporter ExbD [Alphaproteobacteria bacterium]